MKTFLGILGIIGYGTTVVVVVAFFVGIYRWFAGISPALLRLGKGLAGRLPSPHPHGGREGGQRVLPAPPVHRRRPEPA